MTLYSKKNQKNLTITIKGRHDTMASPCTETAER